jgi:hypothetical protein
MSRLLQAVPFTVCCCNSPTGQLYASLLPAQSLLSEVARMGPLMSLIKANVVRDEFLRINRDITSTFSLLAAGEQLLVRTVGLPLKVTRPGGMP